MLRTHPAWPNIVWRREPGYRNEVAEIRAGAHPWLSANPALKQRDIPTRWLDGAFPLDQVGWYGSYADRPANYPAQTNTSWYEGQINPTYDTNGNLASFYPINLIQPQTVNSTSGESQLTSRIPTISDLISRQTGGAFVTASPSPAVAAAEPVVKSAAESAFVSGEPLSAAAQDRLAEQGLESAAISFAGFARIPFIDALSYLLQRLVVRSSDFDQTSEFYTLVWTQMAARGMDEAVTWLVFHYPGMSYADAYAHCAEAARLQSTDPAKGSLFTATTAKIANQVVSHYGLEDGAEQIAALLNITASDALLIGIMYCLKRLLPKKG
jgi:hypothetical protein